MTQLQKRLKSASYFVLRYLFQRRFLIAASPKRSIRLRFKTEDAIGRTIFKKGDYETHLSDFISESVRLLPGEIALDIGANIGWHSLLLARVSQGQNPIYAFEPDPLNFALLTENLALNGITAVHPFNLAVGEESGTKRLFKYPAKNLGRHSLLPIHNGESIDVACISLNEFFVKHSLDPEKVRFIKVDVEGYELFVLRGGSTVLKHARIVVLEYIPEHMIQGGLQPEELLDTLYREGLKPHLLDAGQPRPVSREEISRRKACDLVWLR